MMEGWGKSKQAAQYANITVRTLRSWFKQGLKYAMVSGRLILVKYSDIDDFLRSNVIEVESEKKRIDKMVDELIRDVKNKS